MIRPIATSNSTPGTVPLIYVDDNPRGGVRVLIPPAVEQLTKTLYSMNPGLGDNVVHVRPIDSLGSTKLAGLQVVPTFMSRGMKTSVPVTEWIKQFEQGGYKVAIANFAGKPLNLVTLDQLKAGELGLAVDKDEQNIAGPKVGQPSAIFAGYTPIKAAAATPPAPPPETSSMVPLLIGGAVVLAVGAFVMSKKPERVEYAPNGRRRSRRSRRSRRGGRRSWRRGRR